MSEPIGVPPGGPSFSLLEVRREEDLLWVTLNNPAKANALSPAMAAELRTLYRRDWRAEGVRAILLRGAGKHFCAGADLEHLVSLRDAGAEDNRRDSAAMQELFASILYQPALTIALVHGSCVAGGCGIATAHDYVIGSADSRYLYSEVKIGFVAALVATFLPLRVKGRDLRELLLDPQFVDAGKAYDIGLINRIIPESTPEALEAAGRELAAGLLERASSESIARTKGLLLDAVGRPLAEAMERAAEVNAASRATADCRQGIATFLETKKAPLWR